MYKNHSISLTIPTRNESRLIGSTLQKVPDLVDRVYVVDDGSTDNQNDIIREMIKKDPRIVLIVHETNKGPGAAIISGYLRSSQEGFAIAVVVGGDDQMPMHEMPNFLDPIIDGRADYTKGNRFLIGKIDETLDKMPKVRLIGNWIITIIAKFSSGFFSLADFVDGYTAISKEAIDRIRWDRAWQKYGYPMDFLIRVNAYKLRAIDIPRTAIYLPGVKQSQIKGFRYAVSVTPMLIRGFFWRLKFRYLYLDFHPIFLFYLLGMVLFSIGVLLGLFLVFDKLFMGGNLITGSMSILTSLLSITGIQFLLFAVLFEVIESKIK